jgi:hypothetical protein
LRLPSGLIFFQVELFRSRPAMPALFAYLIAVGLLLGGGYGALSWLAAPEPVKVAVKAKPKLPPREEASAETRDPEATPPSESSASESSARAISDRAAAGSSERPLPPLASGVGTRDGATEGAREQGGPAEIPVPAPDQQSRSANAEITPAQVMPAEPKQPAPGVFAPALSPASPDSQQTVAVAVPAAKPSKHRQVRPVQLRQVQLRQAQLRQDNGRSEKSGLTLMTLRTIEFPDGRRITQLVPYRSGERALAFEPDE